MKIEESALFLIDLAWPNLFEPARADSVIPWRCKACREIVPSWERKAHHARHQRALARAEKHAGQRARETRTRNLAKARAARAAKREAAA